MTIYWWLAVKFRAFGMTFGKLEKQGTITVPIPVPLPTPINNVVVNERGCFLKIKVE